MMSWLPYVGKEVTFGIRPEDVHDEPEFIEKSPETLVKAVVEVTELMGAETYLYLNMRRQRCYRSC